MYVRPKRPSTPRFEWLTLTGAAKAHGCARATLAAAIRRGDLTAFCEQCHDAVSVKDLMAGHRCSKGAGVRTDGGYRLILRKDDVEKYEVDPVHRAAGQASGRAKTNASRRNTRRHS
jgi:hypothetical protein